MKVLVTGSSGLIGSALTAFLTARGHGVTRLVRSASAGKDSIRWDPETGSLDAAQLEGIDAAVHLAGESIAAKRWSDAQKARILQSRVQTTKLLCDRIAQLGRAPEALVCASAIGYYGDRGEEILDETSASGRGFLSEVCRQWEAAAEPAVQRGIRVVWLRLGVVLSPLGGALAKMLPVFRMGLGGKIGSGRQYMSWISLDDVVGAFNHALTNDQLAGPVNAVAPTPVTNSEFTRLLGRVLHRPALFPLPAPAARLAMGEMADELLLASARVKPARLLATGYTFEHSDLESALRHLLGRSR